MSDPAEPLDPQQPRQPKPPRPGLRARLAQSTTDLLRTRIDKSTWRIRLVAVGFACIFGVIGA